MNKVLEHDKDSELMDEHEIIAALEQNTQWHGSKEKMWSHIAAKVRPAPRFRPYKWIAVAAVMVFFVILFNQSSPLPPESSNEAFLEESSAPVRMFSAMVTEEAAEDEVTVRLDLQSSINLSSTLEIKLELIINGPQELTLDIPVIRVLHANNQGLVTIVQEVPLTHWRGAIVSAGKTQSGTLTLDAPQQPGQYQVEVSVPGTIESRPVFFSQTASFTVND